MTAEDVLAAARTVLSRDRSASLDQVAGVAGVSRSTVYRLFGSREELLRALDLDPDPGTRDRVLAAAADLLGRDGLARLSMDEVAAVAGVSRASLYRLFPGKPALFREVLATFSPLETVIATVERMRDRPPDEVVPEVARAAARAIAGREGIVRTLVFEVTSASAESAEAARYLLSRPLATVGRYVAVQMAAGRLRPMHPVLALQTLVGPILLHLITRALAERELGLEVSVEEAVTQLAGHWVQGMRPEGGEEP